ncbi:MAG: ACP S-malonyltransferase [Verrucomicrobiota bacterium]
MATRAVLLFAGQGAQTVGMGKDLAEAHSSVSDLFAEADQLLDFSLTDAMYQGPAAELTRTSRCQPALYAHGLACLKLLQEAVPDLEIAGCAGLSLGEFTAHAAAGTFDFATGLGLVAKRGAFMEAATEVADGSMAALIGGEIADIERLAHDCDIDVANFNAPGQIVVSGNKAGITKAIAEAENYGVRVAQELDVAGAYHSRLMQSAQDQIAAVLASTEVSSPDLPVTSNVKGQLVSSPDEIRDTLEAQVTGSVRWSDCVQHFLDAGESTFIELGPGRVLAGLMRRIDRKATMHSFGDLEGFEKVVAALGE